MDRMVTSNKALGGSAIGLLAYLLVSIQTTIATQNERLNAMMNKLDNRLTVLETTNRIKGLDLSYVQRPAK